MLYTAVFIFVAIAAFLIVSDLQRSEIPLQQSKVVKETGDNFVNILTLSVKGGDGFTYRYSFPKTLFDVPYSIYLANLDPTDPSVDPSVVIEWEGSYGNFSYVYYVPDYNYAVVATGDCLDDDYLVSNECSNVLTLSNNDGVLTITQEEEE